MALVLFDVDGTIVDTVFLQYLAHRKIWWETLGRPDPHTLPSFEEFMEKTHSGIIFGSTPLYEELGVPISPEEKHKLFKQMFFENHFPNVRLFPGVQEVLWQLREQSHTLYIVSGAPRDAIFGYLRRFDLYFSRNGRVLFKNVFGDIDDKTPTITFIRERENIPPSQCFYIGDTPSDIRAAHTSGVRSITHLSETNRCILEHIRAENPDHIIENWNAIPDIVSHLPA